MKNRRPAPGKRSTHARVERPRQSTVPATKPAGRAPASKPPRRRRLPSPPRRAAPARPPHREVARIVAEPATSLVDVIDNLLNQGVVLNAEVVLALANVDLVYLRLSALLCAADRVLPAAAAGMRSRRPAGKAAGE